MQCAEDSAFYRNMFSVLGLCRLLSNVPRFMRRKKTNMRITRSVVQVKILALVLAAPFCVTAQEKSHVTSDQVTHAIQEVEKLAQKQIQENALPGLAIAVAFQDKAVYAKGFGVRDVNTKAPSDAEAVIRLASLPKPARPTLVCRPIG